MKKNIVVPVVAVMVVATFILWILNTEISFNAVTVLLITIPVLVLLFAILFLSRRISDARANLPSEDEMSEMILLRAGSSSFQLSMFFWLVMGSVDDRLHLEGHTLIGAGILGMAVIFALSWIYHRFIRRSHD